MQNVRVHRSDGSVFIAVRQFFLRSERRLKTKLYSMNRFLTHPQFTESSLAVLLATAYAFLYARFSAQQQQQKTISLCTY